MSGSRSMIFCLVDLKDLNAAESEGALGNESYDEDLDSMLLRASGVSTRGTSAELRAGTAFHRIMQ